MSEKKGLFSELNSIGSGETALKLHKVETHEKTKNRSQEEKVYVVSETKPKTTKKSRITGESKKELKDNKWYVENFEGKHDIVVEVTSPKEAVYIRMCDNSSITIKGKLNSVVFDNCQKANLVFDSIVASCEVVNCKSVKIQVLGTVPTVLIDKTDGGIVYLSKESLKTQIISSKSSELNVSVPVGEDDQKELPIPEQFLTQYDEKTEKLVTTFNSHLG